MDAGSQLRQAREARGLSRSDLSARTKISPAILAAIEDGAFDQLPADTYLRGFVRAYAAEVGLPPGDTVQRYLAERDRTSHVLSAFEAEATIVNGGVDLALPATSPFDAFVSEADAHAPRPPSTALPANAAAADPQPPKMRAPLPASLMAALAAAVVAAIATITAVRWPGSAEPLTLTAMPSATMVTPSAAPAPASLAISVAAIVPATSTAPLEGGTAGAPGMQSVAGEWVLTNRVQATSYKPFEGLQLGYRLHLEQNGETVRGRGEKWSENGRPIPEARRTPIEISGTFRTGRLDLAFTERGSRRTSAGRFAWLLSDAGAMTGTFASDAASSQGSSSVRRAQ